MIEIGQSKVYQGDCRDLLLRLPENSIDVLITSPPYWGQRTSKGTGVEDDPRKYVNSLIDIFCLALPALKPSGLCWLNIGDAYNTPINWRETDHAYSSLGADRNGLDENNSAYKKNREKRKAFIQKDILWLTYGNLLALPYRLILGLCDRGYIFRGEIIWRKQNPLPEGRCRRPHRVHESIFLLAKSEKHQFTITPPVKSVWEFPNEGRKETHAHFSRFPEELPRRCLLSSGIEQKPTTVILDPFAGSGTTGVVAKQLGCSFIGFEIDAMHVKSANERIYNVSSHNYNCSTTSSLEHSELS